MSAMENSSLKGGCGTGKSVVLWGTGAIDGRHADLPSEVQYDGQDHNPVPCAQGRCVVFQKNTRSKWSKCNLRLHYSKGSSCFRNYHKR